MVSVAGVRPAGGLPVAFYTWAKQRLSREPARMPGWATYRRIYAASLVCAAHRMAITARRPAPGLIFHSDRVSQYTSATFTAMLVARASANR